MVLALGSIPWKPVRTRIRNEDGWGFDEDEDGVEGYGRRRGDGDGVNIRGRKREVRGRTLEDKIKYLP
jgi:hypothetical protein